MRRSYTKVRMISMLTWTAPLDRLRERTRLPAVEHGDVSIEHRLVPADEPDGAIDSLVGDETGVHRGVSARAKSSARS
jgi:hypothetical protein